MDKTEFEDKVLQCIDCGANFVWTCGERAFFASKFPPLSEPKRCPRSQEYGRRTRRTGHGR